MSDKDDNGFAPLTSGGLDKIDPDELKAQEEEPREHELNEFMSLYKKSVEEETEEEEGGFEELVKKANKHAEASFHTETESFEEDLIVPEYSREQGGAETVPEAPLLAEETSAGLEALKQQAYEEGFANGREEGVLQGEREGLAAAQQQVDEVLGRLTGLVTGLESLWGEMVRANEGQILKLVQMIAEKVALGHVDTDRDLVKRAIFETLKLIPEPQDVVIHVNEEDYRYIDGAREEFFARVENLKRVSVVSSPSVERGACKIETSGGEVGTDLAQRLEAVRLSMSGEA